MLKKVFTSQINRYYLFAFFKDLGFFSAVIVPFFTVWGKLPLYQIQLIQSWFAFWCFALEVPTGVIAGGFGMNRDIPFDTRATINSSISILRRLVNVKKITTLQS